jgi:hypothetical protein
VILAEDEAKVYLQASTLAVWAPRGQAFTVRCDPGRAHATFFGTLNLKTGHEIVTRAETMTAEAGLVDRAISAPAIIGGANGGAACFLGHGWLRLKHAVILGA